MRPPHPTRFRILRRQHVMAHNRLIAESKSPTTLLTQHQVERCSSHVNPSVAGKGGADDDGYHRPTRGDTPHHGFDRPAQRRHRTPSRTSQLLPARILAQSTSIDSVITPPIITCPLPPAPFMIQAFSVCLFVTSLTALLSHHRSVRLPTNRAPSPNRLGACDVNGTGLPSTTGSCVQRCGDP